VDIRGGFGHRQMTVGWSKTAIFTLVGHYIFETYREKAKL